MRPIRLASSKLLERRWREQDAQIHKQHLRTVQSAVRTQFGQPPYQHDQRARQAKKDAVQERKYADIERENRILLEKMSNIMQDPKPKLYNPKRFEVGSLNRDRRKKDLIKITIENQAILRRLQEKQPTYSVEKWNIEHKKNEELKRNLMEHPPVASMPAHEDETNMYDLPRIQTASGARLQYGSEGQRSGLTLHSRGNLQSAKPLGQGAQPLVRQAENLDEHRSVLYKRSKQLGQGYFIVEISTNKTHLFIAAQDVESPESLLIELPEKRAQEILKEFQHDYERMADSLQVMNKRLVLLNPKFKQQRKNNEIVEKPPSAQKE